MINVKSKAHHLNYLTRDARKEAFTDERLNDLIVNCIQDVKGKDIIKLDLRKLEDAPADYFIICNGDSSTQIKAIGNRISTGVHEELGVKPYHVEGKTIWALGITGLLPDLSARVLPRNA